MDRNDFLEFFVVLFSILVMASVMVSILLFFGNILDRNKCVKQSISFDKYEYSFQGGCMVKHNNEWLPLNIIRVDKDEE